ncbi:FBP domain-containing protein, partial [Kibdelosporangium lantanae]
MRPVTERDIRTSFVNCSKGEAKRLAIPKDLANRPWDDRRLCVLDHGRLVGVVSRRDLLKVFLRSDDEIRVDIEREVFQRVLWADPSAVTVIVDHGVVTLTGTVERRSEVEI